MLRNTSFLDHQRSRQAGTRAGESHPLPVLHSHPQSLPSHLQLPCLPPRAFPLETPTTSLSTGDSNSHSWYSPTPLALSSLSPQISLTAMDLKEAVLPPHLQFPGDPASCCGQDPQVLSRRPSQPFLHAHLYPSLLFTNLKKHSLPGNPWPPCFSKIQ